MGKKDNKKKAKGAEKTAAKTEKKTAQKIKNKLKADGEEDIDTLLAKFKEADRKQQQVIEELIKEPPSKRSAFSLTPHPEKDQLFMFGGEHFNGAQALVYSDLFSYTIKQDRWHKITSPGGPPPRCSHQTVAVPQNGGELWVFGGEFTSKSQSQFYHYKDLWKFSLTDKRWEKISVSGGPSGRSGHRMVLSKRKLFIFGGFHDNGYNYKYYNDVHAFDLDKYEWLKLEIVGTPPKPRSASGLAALSDGKLLLYGGYSRTPVQGKKEDQGTTHTDMFYLAPDKHDTSGLKYKWQSVKQSGDRPSPSRCSFALTFPQGGWGEDKAFLFGGVNDTEQDEDIEGQFFNELYMLDMSRGVWAEMHVTGKKSLEEKKKRRKQKDEGRNEESDEDNSDSAAPEAEEESLTTVVTDGVFTLTMNNQPSTSDASADSSQIGASLTRPASDVFCPPPRISSGVAIKKGVFYLYGGMYEEGDRQLTLNDFHSLDLTKLEEWKTIKALNREDLEWFDSDSEDDSEDESGSEEDDENASD